MSCLIVNTTQSTKHSCPNHIFWAKMHSLTYHLAIGWFQQTDACCPITLLDTACGLFRVHTRSKHTEYCCGRTHSQQNRNNAPMSHRNRCLHRPKLVDDKDICLEKELVKCKSSTFWLSRMAISDSKARIFRMIALLWSIGRFHGGEFHRIQRLFKDPRRIELVKRGERYAYNVALGKS